MPDPAGWVDRGVRDGWLENSTSAADRLIATILAWAVPRESLRELAQHGMPDLYCMMLAREKRWLLWRPKADAVESPHFDRLVPIAATDRFGAMRPETAFFRS